MKVLITGASGFIGTVMCEKLEKEGIEYVKYDLIKGDDIRDEFKLDSVFERNQFTHVIHLAARAGVRKSEEYPNEFLSTNVIGTNNVIRMCKKYGVEKLIFYSSSSVLGGNKREETGLDESMDYDCHSLYAQTKMFGELLVKESGLNYVIIRPFTVYGENGRGDMVIYKWINQIKAGKKISFFGKGMTSRGYTYVGDLVDGTISFLKSHLPKSETINLGGSEIIRLSELMTIFSEHCKKKKINFEIELMDMPTQDVEHSFADTTKAKSLIGFDPAPKFYEIVKKILKKEL